MAEREEEGREPDSKPRGEEQGEVGEQGREELGREPDSWVVEGQEEGEVEGRSTSTSGRGVILCQTTTLKLSLSYCQPV